MHAWIIELHIASLRAERWAWPGVYAGEYACAWLAVPADKVLLRRARCSLPATPEGAQHTYIYGSLACTRYGSHMSGIVQHL